MPARRRAYQNPRGRVERPFHIDRWRWYRRLRGGHWELWWLIRRGPFYRIRYIEVWLQTKEHTGVTHTATRILVFCEDYTRDRTVTAWNRRTK